LGVVLIVVCLAIPLVHRPWDPRMGAEAAGGALTARLHNGGLYVCKPLENDETILGTQDVDYVCNSPDKRLSGYWIGTDLDSITKIQPNG
jgi:hypothetical protein